MEENEESKQKDRTDIVLDLEEKKFYYHQKRQPILWYIVTTGMVLIIAIVTGTCAYLFDNGVFGFVSIIFILATIILVVMFFPNDVFNGMKRIEDVIALRKGIQELQTVLRIVEEVKFQQLSPRQRYKEELYQTIAQYQRQANSYRRTHYTLQIFIILFSLLATALASGLTNLIGWNDKQWITAIFTFIVSFLTGLTTLFRFHDRGYNLQQTADAIDFELKTSDLRIFDYSPPLSDDEVLHKLSERGARLTDEQKKRQLQLEQASNTKQTPE